MVYVPIIKSYFSEVTMGHKDFVKSFVHIRPEESEDPEPPSKKTKKKKVRADVTRVEEVKETISMSDQIEDEDSRCFSQESYSAVKKVEDDDEMMTETGNT